MQSELQLSVERWSGRLGQPMAIFDENNGLVVHSSHVGVVDDVRRESILSRSPIQAIRSLIPELRLAERSGPIKVPLPAGLEMQPRVVVPLHHAGAYLGSVWISDPEGSLTDSHWGLLTSAADEMAALLHEQRFSATPSLGLSGELRAGRRLADLLEATDAQLSEAWHHLGEAIGRTDGTYISVLAIRAAEGVGASELHRRMNKFETARPLLALEKAGHGIWGVVAPQALMAGRVASVVKGLRTLETLDFDPAFGVSGAVPWGGRIRSAVRNAELALDVAGLLPEFDRVAFWPNLGVVGLSILVEQQDPEHWSEHRGIRALLESGDTETLQTLERLLDNAGSVPQTATQLNLHRATVYYRIGKAESLLAESLRDGALRTLVHVALKGRRLRLARLRGE